MGNKLGSRRQVVDEKYTRPQGLYNHKDVDHKKLRKLIRESKLAPCYPGDDDCSYDLEECPICFLYYPSLNRSRCCMKSICTECFLQMKVPNSTRPSQCPFCKMANYAVEYRGVKSKEEKGLEQIEEQRVIEAKIRMRQQQLLDEEESMRKRQEISSSDGNVTLTDVEYCSNAVTASSVSVVEGEEIVSSPDLSTTSMVRSSPVTRANRDDEFDLDLEDIMVMEAIWLSIQESGKQRNLSYADSTSSQYVVDYRSVSSAMGPLTGSSSSSPSAGLACAVAALAERQQTGGESSVNSINGNSFNIPQVSSRFYNRPVGDLGSYPSADDINEVLPSGTSSMTRVNGGWDTNNGQEVAEAATLYASSVATTENGGRLSLPRPDDMDGSLRSATSAILPETFEEQMMLAMVVSLADAQPLSNGQSASWQ